MNQSMWVDPEGLRAQGASFREIGEQAAAAVAKLKATLAAEGKPWGTDRPGKEFEKTYKPDADKAITSLTDMAESLKTFGSQIAKAADSYDKRDQEGAAAIRNASNGEGTLPLPVSSGNPDLPAQPSTAPLAPVGNSPTETTPVTANGSRPIAPVNPTATPAANGADPTRQPSPGQQQPAADANTPPSDTPDRQKPASADHPGAPGGAAPDRTGTPTQNTKPTPGRASAAPNPADRAGAVPPTAGTPNTAGPGRTVSAPGDRKPPSTPWSRPSTPGTGRPGGATSPGTGRPGQDGARPGLPKKAEKKSNKATARRTPWEHATTEEILRIAQEFAEKYELEIAGFDTPGLDESAVREFLAGIDDVLTRYPIITLRRVAITDLEGFAAVQIRRADATPKEHSLFTGFIDLDAQTATRPQIIAEIPVGAADPTITTRDRQIYAATVRELGRALDTIGGGTAQRKVQKTLIAEYLGHGGTGHRQDDLSRVTDGYKQWRGQLSTASFPEGKFDPAGALTESFVEVMLYGSRASAPAKTLHLLLIRTAILAGTGVDIATPKQQSDP